MSYRKRAKSGWNVGKSYKKQSMGRERNYQKDEIRESLEEYEQGEYYRTKYRSKRKPKTELQKLERSLCFYERWQRSGLYFLCEEKQIEKKIKEIREKIRSLNESQEIAA